MQLNLWLFYTMKLGNISHYGDILAIPFFALLVLYFYEMENKTILEYILFAFSIAGFVLDILYTILFLRKKWMDWFIWTLNIGGLFIPINDYFISSQNNINIAIHYCKWKVFALSHSFLFTSVFFSNIFENLLFLTINQTNISFEVLEIIIPFPENTMKPIWNDSILKI
jgi:hypothetical protein